MTLTQLTNQELIQEISQRIKEEKIKVDFEHEVLTDAKPTLGMLSSKTLLYLALAAAILWFIYQQRSIIPASINTSIQFQTTE